MDDEQFLADIEKRANKLGPQHYTKVELGRLYRLAGRMSQWDGFSGRRQGSYVKCLVEESRDREISDGRSKETRGSG